MSIPDEQPFFKRWKQFASATTALTILQFSNWRWSWPQMLLTGILAPVISALALGLFARELSPRSVAYVVSGSVVLSLLFETQGRVASNLAFMKAAGSLEYLSSFPISRNALLAANFAAFGILAAPAVIVTIVAVSLLLQLSLDIAPLLLVLALLLSLIPFVALGTVVGARARSLEEASSVSLAVTLVLASVGPVAVPPELLPAFLVEIGHFNPAVYASTLVRDCLTGQIDAGTIVAGGVMLALAACSVFLIRLALPWQARVKNTSERKS